MPLTFTLTINAKNRVGEKTMRVANKDASKYVNELKEFKGSYNKYARHNASIFAENESAFDMYGEDLYVVYSYGYHFPMYIYDRQAGIWIGSNDRHSVSTTRHQSHCRPSAEIHCWLDTAEEMNEYIRCGSLMKYMEIKARREIIREVA